MLSRRSSPGVAGPPSAGGSARPSNVWHEAHAVALNVGPRPSRLVVDAGAITQFWVKKLSPTSKSARLLPGRLLAGSPNAFWLTTLRVVSPPRSESRRSASATSAGRAARSFEHPANPIAIVAAATIAIGTARFIS